MQYCYYRNTITQNVVDFHTINHRLKEIWNIHLKLNANCYKIYIPQFRPRWWPLQNHMSSALGFVCGTIISVPVMKIHKATKQLSTPSVHYLAKPFTDHSLSHLLTL